MMLAIRKRAGDFAAILALVVIGLGVGLYIVKEQRLRLPFIDEPPLRVNAELSTAQAVTPGQGQTVRVAGVKIGAIGEVTLKDGRAYVVMEIDPQYKNGFIRQDASALLRTKTGLKDMFIELHPGTNAAPPAREDFTIPVSNTLPDVNPDEVLSALDADTRDYLKLLINGAGRGLDRRGSDLQEVLARFEPLNRDVARLTTALARRRQNTRRLIHNLRILNTELATSGRDISELIDESAVVFRAFAAEQVGLRQTLREFPSSLRQTSTTLAKVHRFANVLRPTADRLRPAVRSITSSNPRVRELAVEATPTLREEIRPFVKEVRPLLQEAVDPVDELADGTQDLKRSFGRLNDLFNLIAYNPGGRESPRLGQPIKEGWLFHIAWVTHQTEHLFTVQDAHGSYRPVFIGGTCETIAGLIAEDPTGIVAVGANFLQLVEVCNDVL